MNFRLHLIALACLSTVLTGCASSRAVAPDPTDGPERTATWNTKKTLLTVGSVLLVGAIVAHEAQDGAQDAVRSVRLPQ